MNHMISDSYYRNAAIADAIKAGNGMYEATLEGQVDALKKEVKGLVNLRNALTKALTEVAPSHPLTDKEARNKIYFEGYYDGKKK